MFPFERLDVWHEAIAFADLVYSITRSFPGDERFGLTNQMRRAAVSISSNLAEGTSRTSRNDYARFIESSPDHVVNSVLKKLWRDQDYRKWRDQRRAAQAGASGKEQSVEQRGRA